MNIDHLPTFNVREINTGITVSELISQAYDIKEEDRKLYLYRWRRFKSGHIIETESKDGYSVLYIDGYVFRYVPDIKFMNWETDADARQLCVCVFGMMHDLNYTLFLRDWFGNSPNANLLIKDIENYKLTWFKDFKYRQEIKK